MSAMKMSRREAMQISTSALAGLSLGALEPGEAAAQATPQPEGLVDTKLRDAAKLALPRERVLAGGSNSIHTVKDLTVEQAVQVFEPRSQFLEVCQCLLRRLPRRALLTPPPPDLALHEQGARQRLAGEVPVEVGGAPLEQALTPAASPGRPSALESPDHGWRERRRRTARCFAADWEARRARRDTRTGSGTRAAGYVSVRHSRRRCATAASLATAGPTPPKTPGWSQRRYRRLRPATY